MALTKVGKEGITGISNSSDANAITIDSSENVGVGTASPSGAKLEIFTGSTAADGLKINRFGSGVYYSTLRMDSHGLAVHVGDGSNISERAAITPNGLTFNGDTAAANALHEYEEGTWNVTIVNGSLTPSISSATYTVIGNRVFLSCKIVVPTNTESLYMALGGLPFSTATDNDSAGSLAYTTATTSDSIGLLVQGTIIYFYKDATPYATSEFSNKQLRLSAQYRINN